MSNLFLILLVLCVAGLAFVGWLIFKEQKETGQNPLEESPEEIPTSSASSTEQENLLNRIGLGTKPPEQPPLPSLKDYLESQKKTKESAGGTQNTINPTLETPKEFNPLSEAIHTGKIPPNLNTDLIAQEIDAALENSSLKQQIQKLEQILKEKSEALEKAQHALSTEIKNRKEFNTVKNILEKELSEIRDRNRKLQMEVTQSKTDTDSFKRQAEVASEKIKQLEKDIAVKIQSIDSLQNHLNQANQIIEQQKQQQQTLIVQAPTVSSTDAIQPITTPENPASETPPPTDINTQQEERKENA